MRGDNSNTGSVIDWSLPPELQAQYDRIVAKTRQLQKEFGIEPMTLEQRHQAYLKRQAEEQRRQEEIKLIQERMGKMRPPPKWKV